MKANEFDKAIRHSYEQGSFDYNPAGWERMAQQLSEAEGKKRRSLAWLPFVSYAASVLFMVGIGAFLMRKDAPHDGLAVNSASAEHRMIFAQPDIRQDAVAQNTPLSAPLPQYGRHTPAQPAPQPVAVQAQAPVLAVVLPQDGESVTATIVETHRLSQRTVSKAPKYIDLSSPIFEQMPDERTGRTVISVAGGLNYGAANSGYAIGFTAYHKIGSNAFVEGDVAFVNNLGGKRTEFATEGAYAAAANTPSSGTLGGSANSGAMGGMATNQGVGSNQTAGKPSSTAPTATDNPTTINPLPSQPRGAHYNMYYAQVTPTVGYNVFKNLSLSGGADVQRLLQNDKLMTISENVVDAKYVPSYDFGFVGKTEYAITKQLKATVYYRHGLNNALTGTEKYVDRNYLQLQLKFSILNR